MPLPVGDYSPFSLSYRDKSNERGSFGAYTKLVTALNFDDVRTEFVAFVTAVNAITDGQLVETNCAGVQTIVDPVTLPAANAVRENKLLVRYYDATTLERFTVSIPTVTLSLLVFETDAKDFVSKSTPAAVSTFVSAFESFVKNPRATGNSVVIESLEFVGRNT